MSIFETSKDPVDITAALMFAKGEKLIDCKITCSHWENCPPLRNSNRLKHELTTHDLTGIKFGRFTVMGMHREINARWVVRCSCGAYELRTSKAIKNPENWGDRCVKCRKVALGKRAAEYRATGRNTIDLRSL